MIAPARHDQKPPVDIGAPKALANQPVKANRNEFVTSANRPKVNRYKGKANVLTTGLMIEFTSVNTSATTANTMSVSDTEEDVTETDGTTSVVTHRPAIVANKRAMKSINPFLRTGTTLACRMPNGIGLHA